jgi:hypothetical protein
MTLNTFDRFGNPNKDGRIRIFVNDSPTPVWDFNIVVFRTMKHVMAVGIDFETFFGGSKPGWESPATQVSYFKGFKLSAY